MANRYLVIPYTRETLLALTLSAELQRQARILTATELGEIEQRGGPFHEAANAHARASLNPKG